MVSRVEELYDYLKQRYDKIKHRYLYLNTTPEEVARDVNISPITARKNMNRLCKEGRIGLTVHSGSFWVIDVKESNNDK